MPFVPTPSCLKKGIGGGGGEKERQNIIAKIWLTQTVAKRKRETGVKQQTEKRERERVTQRML